MEVALLACPPGSSSKQALISSARVAAMSISLSATIFWIIPRSPSLRAEAFAFGDLSHGDVVAAARGTEPAHHMRHAGRAQTHLRVGESLVDLAEHVLVGDEQSSKMTSQCPPIIGLVQGADVSPDRDARCVGAGRGTSSLRRAARLTGGSRHDDEEAGAVGAGDEPFVPVDLPATVDPSRRGWSEPRDRIPHPARVRSWRTPSACPRARAARGTAASVLRRDVGQHVHVALVRRSDVQRRSARTASSRLPRRPARDRSC